mgnify:CR=1 FL=1
MISFSISRVGTGFDAPIVVVARCIQAMQLRRQQERKAARTAKKIADMDARVREIKEIKRAIKTAQIEKKYQEFKAMNQWKEQRILERNILPGPGAYDSPEFGSQIAGGTWSKFVAPSALDVYIKSRRDQPGPGTIPQISTLRRSGGQFNMGNSKSDVEERIYRAADTPGPGQYNVMLDTIAGNGGGVAFSEIKSKTDIEWQIYRSSQLPAAGQYHGEVVPSEPYKVKTLKHKYGVPPHLAKKRQKARQKEPKGNAQSDDGRSRPAKSESKREVAAKQEAKQQAEVEAKQEVEEEPMTTEIHEQDTSGDADDGDDADDYGDEDSDAYDDYE